MAGKTAIARIRGVSNYTANALQVANIAKIAIAMDAATTLRMNQSARRPSQQYLRGIPTPLDLKLPVCPPRHPR